MNWYGFHLEDLVVNGLDRDAFYVEFLKFLSLKKNDLKLFVTVRHFTDLLGSQYRAPRLQ